MPKVGRQAPNKTHTQSVLFAKSSWTAEKARAWLRKNGYYTDGLDETATLYRFRQYDPSDRFRYRTQKIDKPGVSLIVGFVKGRR